MYTSNSEFDLETKVQITNEIRPYTAYDQLNSTLKNNTYKWLLGELDYEDNVAYDGYQYDSKTIRKPNKIINDTVSDNYGLKAYQKWNSSTNTYETVKPSGTYMKIDGALLPEEDLFLHEIYRYLEVIYPDHPDWLELLTHNEIIDAFTNAAAMINYKPNNEFFELVAKNLETLESSSDYDIEAFKIELRNLTSNSYRRKFYGSLIGYKMFMGGVLEQALIFPIIETLPTKDNTTIETFNELYRLKIRNIDYLGKYNELTSISDEKKLKFFYLPGLNNIAIEYIDSDSASMINEVDMIENNSVTANNNFNFIIIDNNSYSINEKVTLTPYYSIYNTINNSSITQSTVSRLFGYLTSKLNTTKYSTLFKFKSINEIIQFIESNKDKNIITALFDTFNEINFPNDIDITADNFDKDYLIKLLYIFNNLTENNKAYSDTYDVIYNPNVVNTIAFRPDVMINVYPEDFKYDSNNHYYTLSSKNKYSVYDSDLITPEDFPVKYGDLFTFGFDKITNTTTDYPNIYTVLGLNRGFIYIECDTGTGSGFNFTNSTQFINDFNDINNITSSSECYAIVITNSDDNKILLRGTITPTFSTFDSGTKAHVENYHFDIRQIPVYKTFKEVELIYSTNWTTVETNAANYESSLINNGVLKDVTATNLISASSEDVECTKKFLNAINTFNTEYESLLNTYSLDSEIVNTLKNLYNVYKEILNIFNNRSLVISYTDEKAELNIKFNNEIKTILRYTNLGVSTQEVFTEVGYIKNINLGSVSIHPIYNTSDELYKNITYIQSDVVTIEKKDSDNNIEAKKDIQITYLSDKETGLTRTDNCHKLLYTYMESIDKLYIYEDQYIEYTIFNEKRYDINITGTVEFNSSDTTSNYTVNFISDESKKLFDNLSVGDKVYGQGIKDNTYIVSLGNYSATMNNSFPKSADYNLKFSCVVTSNPNSVLDDISSYKTRLYNNDNYYMPTFFQKGVYGTSEWPEVTEAPLYGNLNEFIVNSTNFNTYKNALEFKNENLDSIQASILKYRKQLFVEYNINKLCYLENKSGSTTNLLNIEWLDYLYNARDQISLIGNNINVGFNLTLNTDTSGYTSLIDGYNYTQPSLKIKFQTNNWTTTTIPAYIQLGNGGSNMSSYFKIASDILYPNVYGAAFFDNENVTDQELNKTDNSTLYKRSVYSNIENNGLESTDSYSEYTNIDNPLFETPLTEYNIQYFTKDLKNFMVIDGLIFEQSFKNITKKFLANDSHSVKAYKNELIESKILADKSSISLNLNDYSTNKIFSFNYLGSIDSIDDVSTDDSINQQFISNNTISYYTSSNNNIIYFYNGTSWQEYTFVCTGVFFDKNITYSNSSTSSSKTVTSTIFAINNYISAFNGYANDSLEMKLVNLAYKVQSLGFIDTTNITTLENSLFSTDIKTSLAIKDKIWENNNSYIYLTFNKDEDKENVYNGNYEIAVKIGNYLHFIKLNTNKFLGFLNVLNLSSHIINSEYKLFYGALEDDIINNLMVDSSLITLNYKSINSIVDLLSTEIQLPRKFITQGSYDIQLIIDPKFIGTGYIKDDSGELNTSSTVYYNISKSPVFYDTDLNMFYTKSDIYNYDSTSQTYTISDKTDQIIYLKFDEQKYFKNVKFITGSYKVNNKEDSDATYATISNIDNISFDSSDMSVSDRILRINDSLLRSQYNSALENIYTSSYTSFDGQVYGITDANSDSIKLYLGPKTNSNQDLSTSYSVSIKNLIPISSDSNYILTDENNKIIDFTNENVKQYTPEIKNLNVTYPISGADILNNLDSSIKYFKNLLVMKGLVDLTNYGNTFIVSDGSTEFTKACEILNEGDMLKGAISFDQSTTKTTITMKLANGAAFEHTPVKVGFADGVIFALCDDGYIYYSTEYSTLDGVTEVILKLSETSISDVDQIIDIKYNDNKWIAIYKSGSITKIYDISNAVNGNTVEETFIEAQDSNVIESLPDVVSITDTISDGAEYVSKNNLAIISGNYEYYSIVKFDDNISKLIKLTQAGKENLTKSSDSSYNPKAAFLYDNLISTIDYFIANDAKDDVTKETVYSTIVEKLNSSYTILNSKTKLLLDYSTSDVIDILTTFANDTFNSETYATMLAISDAQQTSLDSTYYAWEIVYASGKTAEDEYNLTQVLSENNIISEKYITNAKIRKEYQIRTLAEDGTETAYQVFFTLINTDLKTGPYKSTTGGSNIVYASHNDYEVLYQDDKLFVKSPIALVDQNNSLTGDVSSSYFWKCGSIPSYKNISFNEYWSNQDEPESNLENIEEELSNQYNYTSKGIQILDETNSILLNSDLSIFNSDENKYLKDIFLGFKVLTLDEFKATYSNNSFTTNLPLTEDLYLKKDENYILTFAETVPGTEEINYNKAYCEYLALVKTYILMNPTLIELKTSTVESISVTDDKIALILSNGKLLSINISATVSKDMIENPENWTISTINELKLEIPESSNNNSNYYYTYHYYNDNDELIDANLYPAKTNQYFNINKFYINGDKIIAVGNIEKFKNIIFGISNSTDEEENKKLYINEYYKLLTGEDLSEDEISKVLNSDYTNDNYFWNNETVLLLTSTDGGITFTAVTEQNGFADKSKTEFAELRGTSKEGTYYTNEGTLTFNCADDTDSSGDTYSTSIDFNLNSFFYEDEHLYVIIDADIEKADNDKEGTYNYIGYYSKVIDVNLTTDLDTYTITLQDYNFDNYEDIAEKAAKISTDSNINSGYCSDGNLEYSYDKENSEIICDYYSHSSVFVPTNAKIKSIDSNKKYIELYSALTNSSSGIKEAYFSFETTNDIEDPSLYLVSNFNKSLYSNSAYKIPSIEEVETYSDANRIYMYRYTLTDLTSDKNGYPTVDEDINKLYYTYDDNGIVDYTNACGHNIKLCNEDGTELLYNGIFASIKEINAAKISLDEITTCGKIKSDTTNNNFAVSNEIDTELFNNKAKINKMSFANTSKKEPYIIISNGCTFKDIKSSLFIFTEDEYTEYNSNDDLTIDTLIKYNDYIISTEGEFGSTNNNFSNFKKRFTVKQLNSIYVLYDNKYNLYPFNNIKYLNIKLLCNYRSNNTPNILYAYSPVIDENGFITNDSDFPVTGIYFNNNGYGGTRSTTKTNWSKKLPWQLDKKAFTDNLLVNSNGDYVKLTDEYGSVYNTYKSINIGSTYITGTKENENIKNYIEVTTKSFKESGKYTVKVTDSKKTVHTYMFYVPETTKNRYWISSKVLTNKEPKYSYVKLFKNTTTTDITNTVNITENYKLISLFYKSGSKEIEIENVVKLAIENNVIKICLIDNALINAVDIAQNSGTTPTCYFYIPLTDGTTVKISNCTVNTGSSNLPLDASSISVATYASTTYIKNTDDITFKIDNSYENILYNFESDDINILENDKIYSYTPVGQYVKDLSVKITAENATYNDFNLPQFLEEEEYTIEYTDDEGNVIGSQKYIGDQFIASETADEKTEAEKELGMPLAKQNYVSFFDYKNTSIAIVKVGNKALVEGLYGPTICYAPKYNSFKSLLTNEGYTISSTELNASDYSNILITGIATDGKSFNINKLNNEDYNDGEEHYLTFKLLTISNQNIDIKNINNEDYYEEIDLDEISLFQPNRQYYNIGYPKPPIKIGNIIYNSENREYYKNDYYTNDYNSYIYECDEEGHLIGKKVVDNEIVSYRLDTNNDGDCSDNIYTGFDGRVINLTPKYKSCQDWFKNNFYVKGSEINPLWQIIRIKPEKKNKLWHQNITINKFVKRNNSQELKEITDKRYLRIISSIDNNFESNNISQKSADYLNIIKSIIKFIAYEGDNYYNNSSELELYGLTFINTMNNWTDLQDSYNFDTTLKANYIVNSVRDMSSRNEDLALTTVTEMGLFDKDHKLIAYAQFPPIEYNTIKNHAAFTCVIYYGNMTASN